MSKSNTDTLKKPLPLAQPYMEGKTFSIRTSYKGQDIYLPGFKGATAAAKAAAKRRTEIDKFGVPKGRGPEKTTAAQALQDYAMQRLPFKKGAVQEAVRINHYLRAARLDTLVVEPMQKPTVALQQDPAPVIPAAGAAPVDKHQLAKDMKRKAKELKQAAKPKVVFFKVSLAAHTDARVIPQGLGAHRKAQLTKTANAQRYREVLSTTKLSAVTRTIMQDYMDALCKEGAAPATVALERSIWRVLFNYARTSWSWASLEDNPATELKMPEVNNIRKRVMTLAEQQLMDASLAACRNALIAPTTTLLRETAMRSSEPLQHAYWGDVDWQRQVLSLRDGKAGKRDVPLSPVALQALRELGPGKPDERIVTVTYEALRAAWGRACGRAGIADLQVHDLRRTAATRMALHTGNRYLVKALTGHQTDAMVERYINVEADDVVKVFNAAADGVSKAEGAVNTTSASDQSPAPSKEPSGFTLEQVEALMAQTVKNTLASLKGHLQDPSVGAVAPTPPDTASGMQAGQAVPTMH